MSTTEGAAIAATPHKSATPHGSGHESVHESIWDRLSEDGGDTVVLRRFRGDFRLAPAPDEPSDLRRGVALDCETTGLDPGTDEVLEIGIRSFTFHRVTGQLVSVEPGYAAFQDPGFPIPPGVTRLTGITDADVAGQAIDWAHVRSLLEAADIVLAHNARFDRAFVDPRAHSPRKVWGCSQTQVAWDAHGYMSSKLELLSVWHGFFVDAHRALDDADALLHLVSHHSPIHRGSHGASAAGDAEDDGGPTYLAELLANARKPARRVIAAGAPFETKDALKSRRYRWDPDARAWWREVEEDAWPEEEAWLASQVYGGRFRGRTKKISPFDRFR